MIMTKRPFFDLLKIFDDEKSQNKPNMIHNLLNICNEGCDLKRFMGEPVCKKCAAEPTIMSLIVPPEGIARNPATRPPGKIWSEEKVVWRADTRGVVRNPKRWGFTRQDVINKQFYKRKGTMPGSVAFRLGEDINPYKTHEDYPSLSIIGYKNLSVEERVKWQKVSSLEQTESHARFMQTEKGKAYAKRWDEEHRGYRSKQLRDAQDKRMAKAKAQGKNLKAQYAKRTSMTQKEFSNRPRGGITRSQAYDREQKLKALAGEKSTRYGPCPGALQKHCEKVKDIRSTPSKMCNACYHARGSRYQDVPKRRAELAKIRYHKKGDSRYYEKKT